MFPPVAAILNCKLVGGYTQKNTNFDEFRSPWLSHWRVVNISFYFYIPFSTMCLCACLVASVVSNSLRPHGLYPTRLLWPWDSPGKNTSVGYLFFLQGIFLRDQTCVLHLLHWQMGSLLQCHLTSPILCIVLCICPSQSPNLSLPPKYLFLIWKNWLENTLIQKNLSWAYQVPQYL